ncbi:hypothetical protein P618_200308 [Holospora obtusa F1]|uniref:Uncharacterized protein n=1 Tax=Holospora obtusa F1 TaxID=1399147 RepID=W6TF00_HOLOB|nr:hypothetical protein [Holospora obtusa]ETZ07499.1 hypothetical protein P618_200308 [Holospora obtusa F1]
MVKFLALNDTLFNKKSSSQKIKKIFVLLYAFFVQTSTYAMVDKNLEKIFNEVTTRAQMMGMSPEEKDVFITKVYSCFEKFFKAYMKESKERDQEEKILIARSMLTTFFAYALTPYLGQLMGIVTELERSGEKREIIQYLEEYKNQLTLTFSEKMNFSDEAERKMKSTTDLKQIFFYCTERINEYVCVLEEIIKAKEIHNEKDQNKNFVLIKESEYFKQEPRILEIKKNVLAIEEKERNLSDYVDKKFERSGFFKNVKNMFQRG